MLIQVLKIFEYLELLTYLNFIFLYFFAINFLI